MKKVNNTLYEQYGTENSASSVCEYRIGVRESMSRLPSWLQPIITAITGKPLPGETPLVTYSPFISFMITIVTLIGVMGVNIYLLSEYLLAGFFMLPLTWVMSTGAIRKIQVVFAHHCVHRTFFNNHSKTNDVMLEVLTMIGLVQNGDEYRRDHLGHHSRELFTTKDDSDAALLYKLGFLPMLTKKQLWRNFLVALVSPKTHWMFIKSRFCSNLIRRPIFWRSCVIVWAGFVLIALPVMFKWWHVALVVWLPLFVFYNASALIQFITEHAWMISKKSPKGLDAYADRCWGRFFGEPCPSNNVRGLTAIVQWSTWIFKMAFVHAPVRIGCFVGDLPAHDWHHLCTFKDYDPATWPVAIYSRQLMIDRGHGLGMEARELWGVKSMLNHVFSLLEEAGETYLNEEVKAA